MSENYYESALTQVSRPSRYLGGELGSVVKPDSEVDIRLALAFPDVYEVGMSHIGFPILYNILNKLDRVAAERVYAPWPDMEERLRSDGRPLCSLESTRALADFDIVGFTLQYELSYTNVLMMLDLGGIPLLRTDRGEDAPLVVVGGPCAYNPEPLSDFFDVALIGDGEEAVVELVNLAAQAKKEGWSKLQLLEALAANEGFYVPSFFTVTYADDGCIATIEPCHGDKKSVRRRFLNDLESAPFPTQPLVPFMDTVHNRVAMEIARGCTRGCRFCQAGYVYRPVRERSPETIRSLINSALANSGFEEVSLLSLSSGDYSCIEPLLKELMTEHAEDRVAVSLPSLRVGSLTPELMEEVKKVRKTGFTLAPEAGSERLRKVINKGVSAEDLIETTGNAYRLGWRLVKLYFMMGLPTEEDQDLEAIIDLAAQVKYSGKGTGGNDVNVAVSTFVPKPHTPFQWQAQIGMDETLRRQAILRDGLRKKKLRFKYHEAELSFMEGVFARGDRRLGAVLKRAVELGCRFDGWREHFNFSLWQRAFSDCGVTPEWYLRERGVDEILPWDHIDCGLDRAFFKTEWQKALSESATIDCRDKCHGCGVCDFEQLKMRTLNECNLHQQNAGSEDSKVKHEEELTRVRLRVSKLGRGRMVAHLEYLKMFHRAVRRAGVPVRFSQGFHPAPKISFLEALPMGVASEAELIDMELHYPVSLDSLVADINAQLPEGFNVISAEQIDWKAPSPSAAVAASHYRIAVTGVEPGLLKQRIGEFLAAEEVFTIRKKKKKDEQVNLRPDVINLTLDGEELALELVKGSPLLVTAYLLQTDVETARRMNVRKTGIVLH